MKKVTGDARTARLSTAFRAEADPEHALVLRAYHKSALSFHGLRIPRLRALVREHFAEKPTRAADLPAVQELWLLPWYEERTAALILLARFAERLRTSDLGWLQAMTHGCDGWALLDLLAVHVLGPLALARGNPTYAGIRRWTGDPWLWTRRAAVLVHILPARRGQLHHEHAFATFDELLGERDFFLRKAIGWTLREAARTEPEAVRRFLATAGDRIAPLTRREASRGLTRRPGRTRASA